MNKLFINSEIILANKSNQISDNSFVFFLHLKQFNDLWQKILSKVQKRPVPFLTLVNLLGGDTIEQVCFGCSQEVSVVGVDVGIGDMAVVKGPVLLFYSNVIVSLCEDQKCLKKCKNILDRDLKLSLIYSKRAYKVENDKCGCCARVYPGLRGHRCSRGLTKLYCGEECRDKDWVVHKLVRGQHGGDKGGGGVPGLRQHGVCVATRTVLL